MIKNLPAIQNLVLASLVSAESKKEIRKTVGAGVVEIDEVFHVKGKFTIGEDYDRTPTVAVPLIETLALFIARAGITREHSEKLLVECMTQALLKNDGKASGELAANVPQVAATVERVSAEILAKLPKAKVKGSCKFKGTVERVEIAESQPLPVAEELIAANIGQD